MYGEGDSFSVRVYLVVVVVFWESRDVTDPDAWCWAGYFQTLSISFRTSLMPYMVLSMKLRETRS